MKHINVRSTEIQVADISTLIVPNSGLIAKRCCQSNANRSPHGGLRSSPLAA